MKKKKKNSDTGYICYMKIHLFTFSIFYGGSVFNKKLKNHQIDFIYLCLDVNPRNKLIKSEEIINFILFTYV